MIARWLLQGCMLAKRIISTVLLWGIVLGALFYGGGYAGVVVLTVFCALAQWEFYDMLKRMGYHPKRILGVIAGALVVVMPYFAGPGYFRGEWELLLSFLLIAIAAAYALAFLTCDMGRMRFIYSPTSLGVLYIPCMLHFLVYIFKGPDGVSPTHEGMALVLWLIAVSKFTDVGGFLVGSRWGKHRFAPRISPKKTWEGVIGGISLAVAVGVGLVAAFPVSFPQGFDLALSAKVSICIAITAVFSDLVESAIKRQAQIKDSGGLLPGIGGVFDLLDSLIFTAPLGYFLINTLLF